MAINKLITGKDGFDRTYHKIPTFTIFLQEDGTCQMQIITQNWKDEKSRIANQQPLDLQHTIKGLPSGVMQVAYTMLKKYFPDYADGEDLLKDEWKEESPSPKIITVSQTKEGKLIEKKENCTYINN